MTQQQLKADERELAYNLMHALNRAALLINTSGSATAMINHISGMVRNGTTDGRPPIQAERVPTAADIGRRVKVREDDYDVWLYGRKLVGFEGGRFVTTSEDRVYIGWQYCAIDEEAG